MPKISTLLSVRKYSISTILRSAIFVYLTRPATRRSHPLRPAARGAGQRNRGKHHQPQRSAAILHPIHQPRKYILAPCQARRLRLLPIAITDPAIGARGAPIRRVSSRAAGSDGG